MDIIWRRMMALAAWSIIAVGVLAKTHADDADDSEPPDPTPRPVKTELVHVWDFHETIEGWQARKDCRIAEQSGQLHIESTADDPYLDCAVDIEGGETVVELRVRSKHSSVGSIYWTTDITPQRGEDKRCDFDMPGGGEWVTTRASFSGEGRLRDLRIDPGTQPGIVDIDWIRIVHQQLHPIALARVEQRDATVRFTAVNRSAGQVSFRSGDEAYSLGPGAEVTIERRASGARNLEAVTCDIVCEGWPQFQRTVWVVRHDVAGPWIDRPLGTSTLSVARAGDVAMIRHGEQVAATLGPLVSLKGKAVPLAVEELDDRIVLRGDGVVATLWPKAGELEVTVEADGMVEGPIVRVPGELEQGLLAGLEYLGKGERSSSRLDIETDEHERFAPDRLKVTIPLMAIVSDRAAVAVTWDDTELQPVYATPNFFDGTDDSRMSLKGKRIKATIRVSSEPLHEAIAWCVKKRGLPPLPPVPRAKPQQTELCLAAFDGPLRSREGWGHCLQPNWVRRPYSDIASAVWRLRGEVAPFPRFDAGGGHIANGTIYFVTGHAEQWLDAQRQQIRGFINSQRSDGSYVYDGSYARGHFEKTASGLCATPAARLLEFAYQTGDEEALAAGIKTLEYMRRFRTPRGAQTWECPLHTPDQLASAYLVWAYTRGYELTGNQTYLGEARKWALSGLPFTYLWSEYPIMLYATPPVYGATNWMAPNWMGLPVQWVGGVYAYALTKLAPYDSSVDWGHVARGILISAQQQQYPDGTAIGLLPDSFHLRHQRRQPADINPSGLVSLQLAVDGEVDFLSVARDGSWVVAAPFPVTVTEDKARVMAREGVRYQVLVNGERVVDVNSVGIDEISLRE